MRRVGVIRCLMRVNRSRGRYLLLMLRLAMNMVIGSLVLGHRTAAVTAGGSGVVFMSSHDLPAVGFPKGYPGGGADEVYMYESAGNKLFCVSCSSSGEPRGGITAFLPINWSDVHLPEWVADEGNRVFFSSNVQLVPQDTNGRRDVYEWEREGAGGCVAGSGVNGGCVYLLSGGTSEADSWFIGASVPQSTRRLIAGPAK